jgi:hypothetical protein
MKTDSQRNAVALFVRNPVPGKVKTRLARDIGYENACNFYQVMVKDILNNITSINMPVYLFHDGINSSGLPREWIDASYAVVAQQGDSIGERMAAAFNLLFSDNLHQVALIGSDIPGLDSQLLMAAFQAFESHDVAIVPAYDGGFCLIALRNIHHPQRFFQNIDWSTSLVMQATVERLNEYGLRVKLLKSRQDIDTYDDLKIYCRNPSEIARATNEWLSASGFLSVLSNAFNSICQASDPDKLNNCDVDIAHCHKGL